MSESTVFFVSDHDTHETWEASISEFIDFGSFQRIIIKARDSQLELLYGNCGSYRWVFFPLLEIGCMQSYLNDFFWNSERLCSILNHRDALTAVYGIYHALSKGR